MLTTSAFRAGNQSILSKTEQWGSKINDSNLFMVFIITFLYPGGGDLSVINISCEGKIFKVQHFLQIYFNFSC